MSSGAHVFERIANGEATQDDLEQLGRWWKTFKRAGGSLGMERCFQIPQTTRQHERRERDQWLEIAAQILIDGGAATAHQVRDRLASEWRGFLQGNLWAAYRDDEQPPPGLNRFTVALFMASRMNKSKALTSRHLGNPLVLGNFLALRFPGDRPDTDFSADQLS